MIHDHHPDPNHEAVSEAARIAAVIVTVVETMILVATKDPGRTQQQAQRDARVLEQAKARDQLGYANARDPRWVQSASGPDLFKTWSSCAGWRELDTGAAEVADRVEERLAALYPEAMHRYRDALDAGDDAGRAMAHAAQVLASAPHQTVTSGTQVSKDVHRPQIPGMVIGTPVRPGPATAPRRQPAAAARRR